MTTNKKKDLSDLLDILPSTSGTRKIAISELASQFYCEQKTVYKIQHGSKENSSMLRGIRLNEQFIQISPKEESKLKEFIFGDSKNVTNI